jgi:uncharacterized protein YaeQ
VALKPTIHRLTVAVSDLDRSYFDSSTLTVALHPSETPERLWVRVLAWCRHAHPDLTFTRGLSEPDEPDLWRLGADGRPELWVEVGEPAVERIRKATRLADEVVVHSFNARAPTWWERNGAELSALPVTVFRLDWPAVQALGVRLERSLDLSVTISEGTFFVALPGTEVEVPVLELATA